MFVTFNPPNSLLHFRKKQIIRRLHKVPKPGTTLKLKSFGHKYILGEDPKYFPVDMETSEYKIFCVIQTI